MTALAVLVADAVTAALNDPARPWAGQFVAARDWLLVKDGDTLDDLTVSVASAGKRQMKATRARSRYEFKVAINVQRRVGRPPDRNAVDELVGLMESVCSWFDNQGTAGDEAGKRTLAVAGSPWQVSEVENDPVYDHEMLYEEGEFESLIVLTVMGTAQ